MPRRSRRRRGLDPIQEEVPEIELPPPINGDNQDQPPAPEQPLVSEQPEEKKQSGVEYVHPDQIPADVFVDWEGWDLTRKYIIKSNGEILVDHT